MTSATRVSFALLVLPFVAPTPWAQEAPPETWDELAELHDRAMLEYVEAVSGPKAGDAETQPSYPTLELRDDFLRLATDGEPRAAQWLFGNWQGRLESDHASQLLGMLSDFEGGPWHVPMLQGLAGMPAMAREATHRYLAELIEENGTERPARSCVQRCSVFARRISSPTKSSPPRS